MKRSSTIILQAVIMLIGIGAIAFMLWEPHIEGRNVSATFFEIYFNDPFLAYAYTGSIAFFVVLYQALKLLGYIGQDKLFSPDSLKALRIIKYCTEIIVGFIVVAEAYLFIVRPGDDIAGGVFMSSYNFRLWRNHHCHNRVRKNLTKRHPNTPESRQVLGCFELC